MKNTKTIEKLVFVFIILSYLYNDKLVGKTFDKYKIKNMKFKKK